MFYNSDMHAESGKLENNLELKNFPKLLHDFALILLNINI